MQPIHELLARIRWDAAFGKGEFVLGYWDRVAGAIRHVKLSDIGRDSDNPELLTLIDAEGRVHDIPLHRIREVWRDGRLIWRRAPERAAPTARDG
ncbi:DUF504 domain-containing protein [Sulfuricystis multivorans]|uniref:DUF504 domain-containing protein n=1 Tax=Sulfuricystis multivorans TaxID=2211108 RepID=UPI000F8424B1|nr:DUF504 domain-containing protein [Sulfuricystis multivorans]